MEFVFLSNPKIWNSKGLSVPKLVIKIRNAFISCALNLKRKSVETLIWLFCLFLVFCVFGVLE